MWQIRANEIDFSEKQMLGGASDETTTVLAVAVALEPAISMCVLAIERVRTVRM